MEKFLTMVNAMILRLKGPSFIKRKEKEFRLINIIITCISYNIFVIVNKSRHVQCESKTRQPARTCTRDLIANVISKCASACVVLQQPLIHVIAIRKEKKSLVPHGNGCAILTSKLRIINKGHHMMRCNKYMEIQYKLLTSLDHYVQKSFNTVYD